MRRRARTDANHRELLAALRRCGWTCQSTHQLGAGFPDAVCHRAGVVKLVEFKRAKGALTEAQEAKQIAGWPIIVVRSVEDCAAL